MYFHPNNARPTAWPSPRTVSFPVSQYIYIYIPYNAPQQIASRTETSMKFIFPFDPLGGLLSYLLLSVNYIACYLLALSPPRSIPRLLLQFQSRVPPLPLRFSFTSNKTIRGLSRILGDSRYHRQVSARFASRAKLYEWVKGGQRLRADNISRNSAPRRYFSRARLLSAPSSTVFALLDSSPN